jgi:hypothetical protein
VCMSVSAWLPQCCQHCGRQSLQRVGSVPCTPGKGREDKDTYLLAWLGHNPSTLPLNSQEPAWLMGGNITYGQ